VPGFGAVRVDVDIMHLRLFRRLPKAFTLSVDIATAMCRIIDMTKKNMTELAVGDTIIDPQGVRHTVLALTEVTDDEGDRGMAITVEHTSTHPQLKGKVFTEVREIFPVGSFDSIVFTVA
jgi:hypothetical protein